MIGSFSKLRFLDNTKLLFWVYCFSTTFLVFFSFDAIEDWPNYLAQISIVVACAVPIGIVFIGFFKQLQGCKLFVYIVVITWVGVLNIYFSESRLESLKGMGLFLMSGVWILGVTSVVFRDRFYGRAFCWLCTFFLLLLIPWGVYEFCFAGSVSNQRINLFSGNPIPAGSLVILLSIGPILLIPNVKKSLKLFLMFLLIFAGVLVILIGQRGAILALALMLVLGGMSKYFKLWVYFFLLVSLLGLGFSFREKLPDLYYDKLVNWESLFIRLEYYRVAYQVVKEKPVFGLGYNSSINRFIPPGYKSKFFKTEEGLSFESLVTGVQVFDNIVLSLLGQAGSLFVLVYLLLFFYLFQISFRLARIRSETRFYVFWVGVIFFGFVVQSLTFDSLRYPHLNWIFHSILGLSLNFRTFIDKQPEKPDPIFN